MKKNNQKAFTIVEVVLVLAVAGLIFLAVFIAIPALRRSQRNTQRKNDIARIMSAVVEYQTNNSGLNPFIPRTDNQTNVGANRINQFIKEYVDPECNDIARHDNFDPTAPAGQQGQNTVHLMRPTSCGSKFTDPDGEPYGFDARSDTHTSGDVIVPFNDAEDGSSNVRQDWSNNVTHYIVVFSKGLCGSGEQTFKWTQSDRDLAMWYRLEGGAWFCVDNS